MLSPEFCIKDSQADKFFIELPSTAISQAKSGAGSTTLGAGRPVGQGAGGCCKWGRDFMGGSCGSVEKYDEP